MKPIADFLPTTRPTFKPKEETPYVVAEEPVMAVRFPTESSWREFISKYPSAPQGYCKYGCGGAGYFRRELPVGHPQFGKAITCQCTKDKMVRTEEYRDNLSTREQTFTLDNWVGRVQDPQAWMHAQQAVAQGWGIFVFYGAVGVGKSGLLTGIVNEFLNRKVPALYKTTAGMLDELRASYETDEYDYMMSELCGVKVLALDELWRHKPTEWAEEKLFYLLDERYRFFDRRLTVIATNAEPDYNNALWSRFSDRVSSRVIHVKGGDVRPYVVTT